MNIELHGFWSKNAKEIQESVWGRLIGQLPPEKSSDCCVTIVDSQPQGKSGRDAAFIRVYSDDERDFQIAAELLKPVRMPGAGLRTFVECVLLHRCVEL